ncbi:Fibrocystin [Manis javanica]|nr:Fibrocystin [Manis javanica]
MSASRGWDIAASGRSAIRGRNAGRELRRGRRQRRPRWPGTVLPSGPERGPEREHDGKAPLSLTRPEPFRARASLLQLGNQTRRPVISLLGFPGSWKPGARSPAQRDSPVSKDTSKSAPDGGQPADGLVCVRGGAQRARESETRPGPGSCGPVR